MRVGDAVAVRAWVGGERDGVVEVEGLAFEHEFATEGAGRVVRQWKESGSRCSVFGRVGGVGAGGANHAGMLLAAASVGCDHRASGLGAYRQGGHAGSFSLWSWVARKAASGQSRFLSGLLGPLWVGRGRGLVVVRLVRLFAHSFTRPIYEVGRVDEVAKRGRLDEVWTRLDEVDEVRH